uniref:Endonuclease/exonuclease/phosphatase domain-containing protein n=1 Tax=Seriola lalandi dorsalis TaxID=1841481 RepID=A0A3B4XM15_SERLL
MLLLHSLNASGLRTCGKMTAILEGIKGDILCLQETRWDKNSVEAATNIWNGNIFHNNGTIKSSGVATLIKNNNINDSKLVHKDDNGRLLII